VYIVTSLTLGANNADTRNVPASVGQLTTVGYYRSSSGTWVLPNTDQLASSLSGAARLSLRWYEHSAFYRAQPGRTRPVS
jgi:hypothetical protein